MHRREGEFRCPIDSGKIAAAERTGRAGGSAREMPVHIDWSDIGLRLALTVLAGLAIGYDRSERGKSAGMRTTLLVCLAASVAMIQVNLLLPTAGRASDSFVMNDLMRLPLGILTGMGFIGGGAILRRDDIVTGVTTAATLWLVTVIGLCFGGGQLGLGVAATVLGLLALTALKWVEALPARERRASLVVEVAAEGPSEQEIRTRIAAAGFTVATRNLSVVRERGTRRLAFDVRQFRRAHDTETPPLVGELAREPGILFLAWRARR